MKAFFLKVQLISVALLLCAKLSAATVYPLVLNPQILPPYSNCLLDYAASKRFNVFVLNKDINHSSYSFVLSIKMKQGNTYLINEKVEDVEFLAPSGVPTIVDITPLLNHVKDIKNNGFRFDEGAYEFVFQAFDGHNPNIAVSEPAYLMAYLSQSEPPMCIYPNDNDCVSPVAGGVINFSWIESLAAVPDPSRRFKLEIYEMPDNIFNGGSDYSTRQRKAQLNTLVKTQVPIFSVETTVPFYSFSNTAGGLQKNHTYLWRVQIFKDGSNPDGKYTTSGYYKNDGWSEPFILRYRNCDPWSQEIVAQEKKSDLDAPDLEVKVDQSVTISWDPEPEKYCGYRVGYNVKGQDSIIEWTTETFAQNESSWVISKNIKSGVEYVARIEGITDCPDTAYTKPKNKDFSMQYEEDKDCKSSIPAISQGDDIAELKKGDIIDACERKVRITEVTRNGDGSFSGFGVAILPIVSDQIGIKVELKSVKVNTEKKLTSGSIVSTKGTNPITLNVNGLVNKQYGGTKTNLQTNIAVPQSAGSGSTVSISADDKKVSVSGSVVGSIVDKGELAGVDDDSKVGENGNVTFSGKEKGFPVFDNGQESFRGLQISSYYDVPGQWIALEAGMSATIVAQLTKGDSVNIDSVSIYIQAAEDAVKIENLKWDATKKCEFTIFAGNETEHLNLIAVDKSSGSYNVLGRAFIQSMKREELTLHLVPVRRDPNSIVKESISKGLNAIYNPLGKYFTVQVEEQFDEEKKLEFLNDGLDVSETSLFSLESEDMKQLLQAYTMEHTLKDSNEAYIFICPSAKDKNVKGDMPRNKSVGYVFSDKQFGSETDDVWTIAHELGHGIFDLEHAFDFGVQKRTTTNLMDYTQKTDTKVWQWSVMDNHRSYTLPFLEDAEDAQWTTDGHYYLFTYLGLLLGLDYNTAEMYGRWAEEPDTHIDDKNKAWENTTWNVGGLQQQNHALTGGYHGVELAATLYALKKAKTDPLYIDYYKTNGYNGPVDYYNCNKFLFHRFGDCFAHAEIDENIVPKNISNYDYINAIDYYVNSVYYENTKLGKDVILLSDQEPNIFQTSYSRDSFTKVIVRSLIHSNDFDVIHEKAGQTKNGVSYTKVKEKNGYKIVRNGVLSKLINGDIDKSLMYGGDMTGWRHWTSGHASASVLGSINPDAIVARPELFKYYTKSAISLLCEVANGDPSKKDEAYKSVESIVDWAVSSHEREKNVIRLDGIFAFLIELEKHPKSANIIVKIPVKQLINESKISDNFVQGVQGYFKRDSEEYENDAMKQLYELVYYIRYFNSKFVRYVIHEKDVYIKDSYLIIPVRHIFSPGSH